MILFREVEREDFDLSIHYLFAFHEHSMLFTPNENKLSSYQLSLFLLMVIYFCLLDGAGSLPWPGGSAAKPGKPKGKKKLSSVRQKFDVGCSLIDLDND